MFRRPGEMKVKCSITTDQRKIVSSNPTKKTQPKPSTEEKPYFDKIWFSRAWVDFS